MPKRKVTPFARFLLAMVFIVPLAFAGASYINGEDPIQNFKDWTGMGQSAPAAQETPASPNAAPVRKAKTAKPSLDEEVKRLEKEVAKRDAAIKDLQQQLENCQ